MQPGIEQAPIPPEQEGSATAVAVATAKVDNFL